MKRKIAWLALFLSFLLIFAACSGGVSQGNKEEGENNPPEKPPEEQPVKENDYAVNDLTFSRYDYDTDVGGGAVRFTSAGKKEELTEYKIAWGAEDVPLEGFTYLTSYTTEKESYSYEIPYFTYIPEEAKQIIVESYNGDELIDSEAVALPEGERSEKLYEFQVISDLHLNGIDTDIKYSHALAAFTQIKTISPQTSGIFLVGDMTDGGYEKEYDQLFSVIRTVYGDTVPDLRFLIGNHESYNGQTYEQEMELFEKYTGNTRAYYSFEMNGAKFIALGSVKASHEGVGVRCELGAEQLDWLESELQDAGTQKDIFLFLHQPLKDTVSGTISNLNQKWDGLNETETARMRSILKNYPNATLFTGHTHWHLESERPALLGDGTDANFFNTASVGYLWQGEGDGSAYSGSQGLFVEVYDDYIVVRGREFETGEWISSAQYVFWKNL